MELTSEDSQVSWSSVYRAWGTSERTLATKKERVPDKTTFGNLMSENATNTTEYRTPFAARL
ncbi:hypothetical protein GIB19_13090 [Pseudomonas sp. ITEM 17296]|nr:hypothetical protein CR512_10390 [Pseudomonas putida]MDE4538153.1 hypothetical protein [Pseudomonas sp. ITEM 17296]